MGEPALRPPARCGTAGDEEVSSEAGESRAYSPGCLTAPALLGLIRALPIAGGQVAQLVEQRIENPRVGGSIPPLATIDFIIFQRSAIGLCRGNPVVVPYLCRDFPCCRRRPPDAPR